jgi:very-short-patch-repair endonuclease
MWNILHSFRGEGHHFRRQVQIGPYYVDFANLEEGLIIEVDGGSHTTPEAIEADKVRDAYLTSRGFEVLRVWNNDAMFNPDGVWQVIAETLERVATPTLDPSPHGGGRRRSRTNPLELRERKPRRPRAPKPVSPSPMRGGVGGGGEPQP